MIITSLLALTVMGAQAQAEPTISAKVVSTKATSVSAEVSVVLPEGWHAYQNPPKSEFENPLKMDTKTKGFKLGKVSYPAGIPMDVAGGESLVYEGTVKLPFTATFDKTLKPVKGVYTAVINVSYQICNASTCVPPSSKAVKISWKAGK